MSERSKILGAWLALCFIWGSTYVAIRVAVATFPPFWMAAVRFALGGVVLAALATARGAAFPRAVKDYAALGLIGLLLLVGANGAMTYAEQTVPSGLASLVASTAPLVVAVMALVAPKSERLQPRGWAGLGLGLVGLVILLQPSGGPRIPPSSIAVLFLSVVCWALGSTLSRRAAPRCDPLAGTSVQMLLGAAVLFAISLATEHGPKQAPNAAAIGAVAYLTVAGSCIAFTLFFWLLSKAPAAKVTTYAYVNPVVAVFLGWLLLDEVFTGTMALGAVVTLAGVFLANTGLIRARATE